jgi:hypothetical protein
MAIVRKYFSHIIDKFCFAKISKIKLKYSNPSVFDRLS